MSIDHKQTAINTLRETMKGSAVTRLLAEQNVKVAYETTISECSWSRDTGMIRYPFLMCMSNESIHMLLIFREVGMFLNNLPSVDSDGFRRIVQQAMGEATITSKYPGMIKTFREGYGALLSQGVYGQHTKLPFASPAVKINLYLKLGAIAGQFLNLSKAELAVVNQINAAKTFEDMTACVDQIGQLLGGYTRVVVQDMIESNSSNYSGGWELGARDDLDLDGDQMESFVDDCYGINHDLESKWLQADAVDKYELHMFASPKPDVVSIVDQATISTNPLTVPILTCQEFRKNSMRSVDSMAKIFEARKAAARTKNAKIAKTGLLNVNRVANYRFSDDIFASKMILNDSKNHGFVVLLDCSGSIQSMYKKMAEQVVVLVEFFRKIGVPYRVFGFGATWKSMPEQNSYYDVKNTNSLGSKSNDQLLLMCSSEQSKSEHALACSRMITNKGFSFGHTPTMNAMSQMEFVAKEFFEQNRIDVRRMIIVTDGNPTDVDSEVGRYNSYRTTKKIVVDPITKKTHVVVGADYTMVDINAAILKNRYNISTTTIALVARFKASDVNMFVAGGKEDSDSASMRKDGYIHYISPEKNDVFIVRSAEVDNDMENLTVTADMTVGKATTQFRNMMKRTGSSKKFLNILANSMTV